MDRIIHKVHILKLMVRTSVFYIFLHYSILSRYVHCLSIFNACSLNKYPPLHIKMLKYTETVRPIIKGLTKITSQILLEKVPGTELFIPSALSAFTPTQLGKNQIKFVS